MFTVEFLNGTQWQKEQDGEYYSQQGALTGAAHKARQLRCYMRVLAPDGSPLAGYSPSGERIETDSVMWRLYFTKKSASRPPARPTSNRYADKQRCYYCRKNMEHTPAEHAQMLKRSANDRAPRMLTKLVQ